MPVISQAVPVAMLLAALPAAAAAASCPAGTTTLEPAFSAEGKTWAACEDLKLPGGGLVLVPESGEAVWMPKTFEPYAPKPDEEYYLGLGKEKVLGAKWDMMGQHILNVCDSKVGKLCEPTFTQVESAVPVIRYSRGDKDARGGGRQEWMCSPYAEESGVRTFVGSRSASVDATFSDHADDCSDNGFPRPQTYVMNLTAIAHGEPAIKDFINYVNFSAMADGLVGGVLPNAIFYFPILKQNFSAWGSQSRYWTMIASPVADMEGGREQSVWFRFQQITCNGAGMTAPKGSKGDSSCALKGVPQYYDTYWYSGSPGNITNRWIRPEAMGNASGFYGNMLKVQRYWDATLTKEEMMRLELPSTPANNGSWLVQQAVFSIVRSMISRDDTWHGRYGVLPGYGISLQDGFEDTFTASATAALEYGSFPYAKGVIDNWLLYYVRDNGMTTYRSEELAQSGRMLTIFALYVSMTGDVEFMLGHWSKVKALADWLSWRWEASIRDYTPADPRYGIPPGLDEGDGFIAIFAGHPGSHSGYANQLSHMYSNAGAISRGFEDVGEMWAAVGKARQMPEVAAHGASLLAIAPKMRAAIQASIAKTSFTITEEGPRKGKTCVRTGAGKDSPSGQPNLPTASSSCTDGGGRSYPEMFYSGVLTAQQVDDIYETVTTSNNSKYGTRPMTMGAAGYNNKLVTFWAYGIPYGLLQHDMVERFLLHYFAMSAHTYTRGTWTTPEASHPDRDTGSTDYVAAGIVTSTTYLKWMLLFEEPDNRTVWLAKALPRDWLAPGTTPVVVEGATSRYGRVSYSLAASSAGGAAYKVTANVTLPASYATVPPRGGLRLRLRAPASHAGKLSGVTVGGASWAGFDAEAETVDFLASQLTPKLLGSLTSIVATFSA